MKCLIIKERSSMWLRLELNVLHLAYFQYYMLKLYKLKEQFNFQLRIHMKKQQFSETQESATERLKRSIQSVSSLYGDHHNALKNKNSNSKEKVNLDKIKVLYQHQKVQKMNVLRSLDEAKAKIKIMEIQSETLKFAYKALEVRIKKEKKSRIQINKKFNEKPIRTQKKHHSYKRTSLKKKSGVTFQRIENRKDDIREEITQNLKVEGLSSLHYPQEQDQDNKVYQEKKQQVKKVAHFQQIQLSEPQKQSQKQLFKIYKNLPSEHELPTSKLIQQIQERKDQYEKNQQMIEELQQQITQNQILIQELKQQLQNRQKKISQMENVIAQKQLTITKLKGDYEEVLINLKQHEKECQERQMKQQHELNLLKKFGQDLKIQDKKIKEFIKEQFGVEGLMTQKTAYKQKISYLLHLANKKDDLYEGIIKDLKEKNRQNHYRIKIMEQKLDSYSKDNHI